MVCVCMFIGEMEEYESPDLATHQEKAMATPCPLALEPTSPPPALNMNIHAFPELSATHEDFQEKES